MKTFMLHSRLVSRLCLLALACSAGSAWAQADPDYDGLLAQGVQARAQRDFLRAEQLMQSASAISPADPRARLELAVTYEWSDRLAEAKTVYEALVAAQPGNASAQLGLARVLRWRWDFVSSRRLYNSVLAQPQATAPMRLEAELGLVQMDRLDMRLESAQQRLDDVLAANPDSVEAQREKTELMVTVPRRLYLLVGERQSSLLRSSLWQLQLSGQQDALTSWAVGAAHNNGAVQTLATEQASTERLNLLYAEMSSNKPGGRVLRARAEFRHRDIAANDYQLLGEWSDQLSARWRGNAGLTLNGPSAAARQTYSAGLSHAFTRQWDAGLTTYLARGGPTPAEKTVLARLGWEHEGIVAQLFASRETGQSALRKTALLVLPLSQGYALRTQVYQDGKSGKTAWSLMLSVPLGRTTSAQIVREVIGDERSWALGANLPLGALSGNGASAAN